MALPRKTRGEFRPFYEALWDGPQFGALTPHGKLIFVFIKGLAGATGIKVWPVLDHSMAKRTGVPLSSTRKAIKELIDGGWIEYDGSVVWVVRGLEFEPQLSPDNPLHRKGVSNALQGLPNTPIVARFEAFYTQWVSQAIRNPFDTLSIPLRNQTTTPSPTPTPSPSPTITGDAMDEAAVQSSGRWLVIAANKGVLEKYGDRARPMHAKSASSYRAINDIHAAGVDFDFAVPVIFAYASTANTGDGRPPQSLGYFTQHVINRWEDDKARRDASALTLTTEPHQPPETSTFHAHAISYARGGDTEYQEYCRDHGLDWEQAA